MNPVSAQIALQNKMRESLSLLRSRRPSFSLRAFSKKMGMNHSAVSEILNGKRFVSRKMAERIADRLQWGPEETRSLCQLFPDKKKENSKTQYVELSGDHFHLISDWYYFAILSLCKTENFKASGSWIAKRLGIRVQDAEIALKRLKRLNLLVKDKSGKWVRSALAYTTSDGVSDGVLRGAQLKTLELAEDSLQRNALEDTDFTFMTMAVDPKKMKVAKKMIREFQDKLSDYMESESRTEVYRLGMQLFPLSILKKKGRGE